MIRNRRSDSNKCDKLHVPNFFARHKAPAEGACNSLGAIAGQIHQAHKKRQSLPNDQEVTFPELEPAFDELDEAVKKFGTLPGWGGGDQARWSSIAGFPEQVLHIISLPPLTTGDSKLTS